VVCFDQASKIAIRSLLPAGETWAPWTNLEPYLKIVHSWNTGIFLGMVSNANGLIIAVSEVVILAILFLYPRMSEGRNIVWVGLGAGLLLGGAIGNLIDRVLLGYVTDVMLLSYLPVFNLADVCLLAGMIILVGEFLTARQRSQ
jgi:signal peptidase II